MIHTDGKPTIASRTTPVDKELKAAYRLKALAPITYRILVAAGRMRDVG